MTAAGLLCGSCGTALPPDSRFCNKCGTPITPATPSAEYKQVTVLFADVVHPMDIAAAVGAERLREIMGEPVNCASSVVQHCGGTVDKFTGDGRRRRAADDRMAAARLKRRRGVVASGGPCDS